MTHNYLGAAGLPAALAFARAPAAEQLLSGCAAADRAVLAERLVAALRLQRPEVRPEPCPACDLLHVMCSDMAVCCCPRRHLPTLGLHCVQGPSHSTARYTSTFYLMIHHY